MTKPVTRDPIRPEPDCNSMTASSLEHRHRPKPKRGLRELFFLASVGFKGIDGILESLGGIALLVVNPGFILRAVQLLTQDEIAEDPLDRVANTLLHLASHLSISQQHFLAIYLLVHGLVKVGLVWALLARVLIAYPLSIAIFGVFTVYQLYRYNITQGLGLLLLTALDLVVVGLVYLEYRALRRART